MAPEKNYDAQAAARLLPMDDGEQGFIDAAYEKRSVIYPRSAWMQVALVMTVALIVGVFFGRFTQPSTSRHGLPYPSGSVQKQFHHNFTFTQKPDAESEAAWASIIPVGRGFIHHDEIAPFISNIAVFHQLHCLHAVVIAYYDALAAPATANLSGAQNWDNATQTRIAIPHIRHCFDYLRQSIMCASDTNLEVLDRDTHLTNGWGQPKTCRDYAPVFAWAEKYANSTDRGIVT